MVADLVRPRVSWVPEPADDSLAMEAVEWCRAHGLSLDPEQELVLGSSLGVRGDGRWQSFEVGVNAPRQNGKGEILMARELFGAYVLGEMSIVHSAHEFKTSERHFRRLEAAIRADKELFAEVKRAPSGRVIGFRYSHGDEAIEFRDGAMIEFRTRTRAGMRGFDDVSVLVLDEAMIFSEAAQSAMLPTVRASKAKRGPQLWYAGSAADQDIHEHAVVWARVRERALAGDDPGLAYFEWSLDFDHPDSVPDDVASDPAYWRMVNWALERGRVDEDWMRHEFRTLLRRGFIVELLGVGDWPATDGSADVVISEEDWKDVEDPGSVLEDPVCLAFDVSPDRNTAIVAVGGNGRGKLHIEIVAAGAGTGWVAARLTELYRKHEVVEIVCDGLGPSTAIAKRVDDAGITVRRVGAGEYAEACGMLVDHVGEKTLVHIGQDELSAAVRGARTRPLVDRWAWSRTKSVADIGTLIAGSLALWSAVDREVLEAGVAIF